MGYNASMATKWKVTAAYKPQQDNGAGVNTQDAEEPELEKLSRGATLVARESMKLLDAQKAQACRQQMIQELLSAK